MNDRQEIIEKIPLLAQGRLDAAEAEALRQQIGQSAELQKEYQFWLGMQRIRREMPRFDSWAHPTPELLDRYALGKINKLSAEYSHIFSHLQHCPSCGKDIELLRQSAAALPQEALATEIQPAPGFWASFVRALTSSRVLAPVAAMLIVVLGLSLIVNRAGEETELALITLSPQFEKRSMTPGTPVNEMPVSLARTTNKIVFAFATDRVEIPDYHYVIRLAPPSGAPIDLSASKIDCKSTELKNQCELMVTESEILNRLKQGGSFALTVKEEFPGNAAVEPAEYEYYFNVTVRP